MLLTEMEIDFNGGKIKIINLIEKWAKEVIDDLMNDIKSYAGSGNLRDLEQSLETIKEIKEKKESVKAEIIEAKNTQQLLKALDCDIFSESDSEILSEYLGIEVIIKREN
jgi:hypothetical protein